MTPSIIPVALLAAAMTIPAASFASNANGDSKLSGNATPNNATTAANDTLVNRTANGTEPKQGAFAEISGQITDNNGNPINEATITVKGMKRAVRTKANGYFTLSELPSGETTILVHAIGYATQQRTLQLSNKSYTGVNFALQERSDALPTVDVMGRREQSYKNSVSFVGTKTATALKDVPQSIGYVTKELVLDQGAITVNDVVKTSVVSVNILPTTTSAFVVSAHWVTLTRVTSSMVCADLLHCGVNLLSPISSAWKLSKVQLLLSLEMLHLVV